MTMTVGKTDYDKGGVATYAHKWKTSDIRKCKPSGRLHGENNQQDCVTPPPLGGCCSSLNPPIISTYNKVTGATTNMLRKENRKKCHNFQEDQGPQAYWSTHEEKFRLPAELPNMLVVPAPPDGCGVFFDFPCATY